MKVMMEERSVDNPAEEPLSPETMELMQSIVVRHEPSDPHHMRTLMTNAGLQSGAYAMAVGLMWWITVAKGGAQLGDSDIPSSLIGMQFHSISIMVPVLVLISSFVFALGSYRGNPGTSSRRRRHSSAGGLSCNRAARTPTNRVDRRGTSRTIGDRTLSRAICPYLRSHLERNKCYTAFMGPWTAPLSPIQRLRDGG